MRKGLFFLLLAAGSLLFAAGSAVFAQSPPSGTPSKEAFINQVFRTVVDSSFDRYYLYGQADPCSFVKYEYDEWIKYDLQEAVPIYILNELAEKSYYDKGPGFWEQDSLAQARCLTGNQSDSIIHPFNDFRWNRKLNKRQRNKALRQSYEKWHHLPAEEKIVYYFSRPEFTDDGQYGIIDMDYRCGSECGLGTTCLFRRTSSGWKMIGKRLNWIS